MTRELGWSKNVLVHQIDNQSCERSLLGQTNFDQALTPVLRVQARSTIRDEHVLDFLEPDNWHSERELGRILITRIEDLLHTMDGIFVSLGSQYRPEIDGGKYLIDLLPSHHRLRFLVAIELKISKFEPEFVGRMQFYLMTLDEQVRQDDENPSIDIILCKGKKRIIVEYAPRDARKLIGVATYVVTKSLPRELQGQLSLPEAIARLLEMLQPRPLKTGCHDQLVRPITTTL